MNVCCGGAVYSLLRPRRERPSDRTAERGYEFSPSNVDCHVTLPRGVMPAGATLPRFDCVVCGYVMSEDGPITLPLLQPIAMASTDESSRVGDAG